MIDEFGTVKDRYKYPAFGAPDDGQTVSTNQPNRRTGKPVNQ